MYTHVSSSYTVPNHYFILFRVGAIVSYVKRGNHFTVIAAGVTPTGVTPLGSLPICAGRLLSTSSKLVRAAPDTYDSFLTLVSLNFA